MILFSAGQSHYLAKEKHQQDVGSETQVSIEEVANALPNVMGFLQSDKCKDVVPAYEQLVDRLLMPYQVREKLAMYLSHLNSS